MNKLFLIITSLFFTNLSFSQGLYENELTSNPIIAKKYNELIGKQRTPFVLDTISIDTAGFVDDFSYSSVYPDTNRWLDNRVYINRTFAKAPITLGVATFEGLDETGYPYDFTAGPSTSAVADYLTSKPINLASTVLIDSIYFSFYYQPQGRGNDPEYQDSLVVQFKHSVSGWRNVKAIAGTNLAVNDSSWKLVMIPITDTAYLKDDFQFRFYNRATISGNTDHWNIDYVYLNDNRTFDDTIFNDISFVYNATPLLKNYMEMPWRQYNIEELRKYTDNLLRNNYTGTSFTPITQYRHQVTDIVPTVLDAFTSGGAFNLLPYFPSQLYTECDFSAGCLKTVAIDTTLFPLTLSAPWRFTIKKFFVAANLNPENDTLEYEQNFRNHYAYDDGTAENSFGLSTLYGKLAEKFTLNVGDSLQYIDIYFNPFLTNTSTYTFNLQVWGDLAGAPGPILYTGVNAENPDYSQVQHNQFIRYKLDAPLYLAAGTTFYIGFTQNTTQFLNVGVDKNTNTQNKIFYNVTGVWNNSPYDGSLMMRPVFGAYSDFIAGVEEVDTKNELTVYPNPANDKLYLNISNTNPKMNYSIVDLLGKTLIYDNLDGEYIDISMLENGVYFIQLNDGNKISTTKFIKIKQ